MNETLMQNVYKSIRGDRTALRTLVERYGGAAYALAYSETKSFPRAQRVAMRAWPRVAEKLPHLAEPERFLELLAEAVRSVTKNTPAQPDKASLESSHSILKTGKVQARRALRKALGDCPRPEANAFFLRFVEGLSTDEIAELYGVEPTVALEAQAAICLDLAYRAGLAGPSEQTPPLEELPADRHEAVISCVRQAESSLDDDGAHRLSSMAQTDPDLRREIEAVRTVLSLSPATFAAHRLPAEFVREAMQGIPFIEPKAPASTPSPRPTQASQPSGDTMSAIALSVVGLILGPLLTLITLNIAASFFGTWIGTWTAPPFTLSTWAFVLTLGVVSLAMARPPLVPPKKWPMGFYLAYACLLSAGVTFLFYLDYSSSSAHVTALWSCVAPAWAVLCLGLVGVRWQLDLQMLEARLDARFRRLETAVQVGPDTVKPEQQVSTPKTP